MNDKNNCSHRVGSSNRRKSGSGRKAFRREKPAVSRRINCGVSALWMQTDRHSRRVPIVNKPWSFPPRCTEVSPGVQRGDPESANLPPMETQPASRPGKRAPMARVPSAQSKEWNDPVPRIGEPSRDVEEARPQKAAKLTTRLMPLSHLRQYKFRSLDCRTAAPNQ